MSIDAVRKAPQGRTLGAALLSNSIIVALGADNFSNAEAPPGPNYNLLNLDTVVFPAGLNLGQARLLLLGEVQYQQASAATVTNGAGNFILTLSDDIGSGTFPAIPETVRTVQAMNPTEDTGGNGETTVRTAWASWLSAVGDPRLADGMKVSSWGNNPDSAVPAPSFESAMLWWFLLAPNAAP